MKKILGILCLSMTLNFISVQQVYSKPDTKKIEKFDIEHFDKELGKILKNLDNETDSKKIKEQFYNLKIAMEKFLKNNKENWNKLNNNTKKKLIELPFEKYEEKKDNIEENEKKEVKKFIYEITQVDGYKLISSLLNYPFDKKLKEIDAIPTVPDKKDPNLDLEIKLKLEIDKKIKNKIKEMFDKGKENLTKSDYNELYKNLSEIDLSEKKAILSDKLLRTKIFGDILFFSKLYLESSISMDINEASNSTIDYNINDFNNINNLIKEYGDGIKFQNVVAYINILNESINFKKDESNKNSNLYPVEKKFLDFIIKQNDKYQEEIKEIKKELEITEEEKNISFYLYQLYKNFIFGNLNALSKK